MQLIRQKFVPIACSVSSALGNEGCGDCEVDLDADMRRQKASATGY